MTEPKATLSDQAVQELDAAGQALDAAMHTSALTDRGMPAEQGVEALNEALRNLEPGSTA